MSNEPIVLSEHACFGGTQGFYEHESVITGARMRFGVYRPPQALQGPLPALFFLAGLTCTEETFAIKAGAQRLAAQHGVIIVTPDTSPRQTGLPGATDDWDFGEGAGFYLDATQAPWASRFRMESWITGELLDLVARHFAVQRDRLGLFGHSMGGHGALTLALRHPGLYRTVSALAPICAPSQVPWGKKAFSRYLGQDEAHWAQHDAVALIRGGASAPPLLVDQGLQDKFLQQQLRPDLLEAACKDAGQPLTLRRHEGYDHGYYFIASLAADHLAHHAAGLAE
jgi:S-formylglutathione hydrolase